MTFKSNAVLEGIKSSIENAPAAEKQAQIKKVNAVFQFNIKSAGGDETTWVLDLKNKGSMTHGGPAAGVKPDIVINVGDDTFVDLASGKTTGQKAFMGGKIKVKGNMMLATKLDGILKTAPKPAAAPAKAASSAPAAASGSSLKIAGVASSDVFTQIHAGITSMSATERQGVVSKAKAVYQFNIKAADKIHTFTLDLKNGNGDVYQGAYKNGKPEIAITIADKDFVDLAGGKLNGQKAFMSGKLKIQGNMMLATKLDTILKSIQKKPKL
ncbi:SCP2 sterol-binding domain-containing protein [Catenaria anguillulae PL171]|uniref:SCP2 sterol-binding domain-containing protein n=1 Tax=Catenaria anguillulae PL171 TaxID=765915 RepID=A0A1Y2I2Y6_9FUNG|nr:SCP2 sterol-binding domain-containing protein [Catenaria anguillulae PL171]